MLTALALAAGVDRAVAIPGKFFSPGRQLVLIGDTVSWRNSDSSSHTVTADDGAFDSGAIAPGASFSRPFVAGGVYKYHCTIHRYMRGEVDVYGLALTAPGYAVPFGLRAALHGLAPQGVQEIGIRQQASDGRFVEVGRAQVAPDGSFRFPLVAEKPAVYVATTGELTSAPVNLSVAARVALRVRSTGRFAHVSVRTDPAQPGAVVQLEKYLLERFDFAPVRRARLDPSGRAAFVVAVDAKLHLRALLATGVDGFGRAVSRTVLVRAR